MTPPTMADAAGRALAEVIRAELRKLMGEGRVTLFPVNPARRGTVVEDRLAAAVAAWLAGEAVVMRAWDAFVAEAGNWWLDSRDDADLIRQRDGTSVSCKRGLSPEQMIEMQQLRAALSAAGGRGDG